MGKFEEVFAINVNDKTEKKGNLTYLSWAWAWAEFKKIYPKATYAVDKFDGTYCTGNENLGYVVRTEVFADDLSYEMWLPIMDMRNNAMLKPKMTDVNKTIMRCLAKNLAMFGLGLYIYAGEDLPEGEEETEQPKQPQKTAQNRTESKKEVNSFKPLTKEEILRFYGVRQVEQTVEWLEGKLGAQFADWNEEQTAWARGKLEAKKKQREEEERQKNLNRIDDVDLPFPMEGGYAERED
jgi:hypothetical protein